MKVTIHFYSTRLILLLGSLFFGALISASDAAENRNAGPAPVQTGTASFYAHKYHGKMTANGEIFDMHQLTAAHPRLQFGSLVKVTNTENNRSVTVRINDRGPYIGGRIIDLSLAAAEELQMVQNGIATVKLELLTAR